MNDREPVFNLPPVVSWIAAMLAAIHLARWLAPGDADFEIVLTFGFIPARYLEGGDLLPGGWPALAWTPLTYSLLHADVLHLASNLLWMAVFGSAVARRFGAARFLALVATASVVGAAVHALAFPGDAAVVIGASAAVSGLMGAAARFAFAADGPLSRRGAAAGYRLPVLPLRRVLVQPRVLAFLLLWLVVNVLTGIGSTVLLEEGEAIAWQAHIGGLLAGLLAFRLFDPATRTV